jgi:predicted DNA binding CopG/RHH family protein
MIQKPNIPNFESEAAEAQWWDEHREETAQWMEEAANRGQTTTLSDVLQRASEGAGATPTVSIRIDPDDLTRARSLAAKKGLRYQTYLKMRLHEALLREERAG